MKKRVASGFSRKIAGLAATTFCLAVQALAADDVFDRVKHGTADSNGVKIHYATLGEGPLVVMIHGFPDFWYSWRHQMDALSKRYQVVAIDQRGYNLSDKPKGQAQYDLKLLADDVLAIVKHLKRDTSRPLDGRDKAALAGAPPDGRGAVIVGHDWGGMVAWRFAMTYPEATDRLIILNLPHPRGLGRELANNPDQQKNSEYARRFQQEGAHKALTAEGLARRIKDPKVRERYVEAFNRSDFEAMLNYYKQNYPKPPYTEDPSPVVKVKAPVLMFHGLNDTALLHPALNRTWEWLEKDLTLVTVPGAGHWVQEDAAELVTSTMELWLARK